MNTFDFEAYKASAIAALREGKPLMGENGVFAPLLKTFIEECLAVEMSEHLSEQKAAGVENRRNGRQKKTVQTLVGGSLELESSRDRAGTFEPKIVPKRQVVLSEDLEKRVIFMYGQGASYNDISTQLAEIYGFELSPAQITELTNSVLPRMEEWRKRKLDAFYAWVYFDAMHFKIRDSEGKVVSKSLHIAYGVTAEGVREVLGIYIYLTEGATNWLKVAADLEARGVKDILFACVDGLKGLPEAINKVFPQTQVQTCIVHQVRNSMRFVDDQDCKAVVKDLKTIYQATDLETAEANLVRFAEKYKKDYPQIAKSWQENWATLSVFFDFPHLIRTPIYTTNPIESLNREIRKVTKTKGAFISDESLYKLVFIIIDRTAAKRKVSNWGKIAVQLAAIFPNRFPNL
jgi:transposase-like protein